MRVYALTGSQQNTEVKRSVFGWLPSRDRVLAQAAKQAIHPLGVDKLVAAAKVKPGCRLENYSKRV